MNFLFSSPLSLNSEWKRKYKTEIILFLLLLFTYSYFWHKPSWNDLGRYDLIMAISEEGKVCIDTFHTNTGDKAFYKGHYYSDKAPGPAFLGVPIYWTLTRLQEIFGLGDYKIERQIAIIIWFWKLILIRIIIVSVPAALLIPVFYRFLLTVETDKLKCLLLSLAYGLGSLAFPYATLFYGHQFASALLFFAFYLLYKLKRELVKNNSVALFLAGIFIGYAVISEFPTILLAFLLLIYATYAVKLQKKLNYIFFLLAGFSIPIALLLYYNSLCSGGNPFWFGYFTVARPEFRTHMEKGIAGVTYPKLKALYGITFSKFRGLFLINPFLTLSIPGFFFFYKKIKDLKLEFYLALTAVIIFFLFNSAYYMWWGGYALGPRHLIPILPFLTIPIVFLPAKTKPILATLTMVSFIFMFIGTAIDPQVPESASNPLYYSLKQFVTQKISLNLGYLFGLSGFYSLIPLSMIIVIVVVYLFLFSCS